MLIVHRSERADPLVDALASVVAEPLDDAVTAEVISVPTRGVERWIAQRLSDRLGVTANVDFRPPARLAREVVSALTGSNPDPDPWSADRLCWEIIRLIDTHSEDPALRPLTEHLRAASPGGLPLRRAMTARHLASLFERYWLYRPEMLTTWGSGGGDGWQPALWRLLCASLPAPCPPDRLVEAVRSLADAREAGGLSLPPRLSLFGLTRLAAAHLRVLAALAGHRDVHLFVLHPSPPLWDALTAVAGEMPAPGTLPRRRDPTRGAAVHPLLRSWARDVRELQLSIAGAGPRVDRHHPLPGGRPDTLLGRLQDSVAGNRPVPGGSRPLAADDRSVQVHSCHGRTRQVEVLRDALLHLFAADPSLQPRDVIVMCPDIEEFAPVVRAVLSGGPEGGGPPRFRVRLADRALRQTNPLLGLAAELLDLAGGRGGAPEILDLLSRPPVARRFGLGAEDLAAIEGWLGATGVRWGLDGEHRRKLGWEAIPDQTWEAGIARLLLGVAMGDEGCRTVGGVTPAGGVGSTSIDLAGRVAEVIARLGAAFDALSGPLTIPAWCEALSRCVQSLASTAAGEEWQALELDEVLAAVADEAGGDGVILSREEAAGMLAERLAGRPTSANFRTGDVTVCTMFPMRSVPHRVVALLGLDDGDFPRSRGVDGDDRLLDDPYVGDRDAAAEDRQLLLDALMAATEHLLVTYSGRDERTNRIRQPCVPLAELLDVVSDCVDGPIGGSVLFEHPLHGYDPRNFEPARVGGTPGPWSHDPVALAGACASYRKTPPGPRIEGLLPPLEEPAVSVKDLVSFLRDPAGYFLRRRLGLWFSESDEQAGDRTALALNALEEWGVGDRMLAARRLGASPSEARHAERGRNLLPPGRLGEAVLDNAAEGVEGLVAALDERRLLGVATEPCEVRLELPGATTLIGSVPAVYGDRVLTCSYSRVRAPARLAAWVYFLALSASRPGAGVGAVTIGRPLLGKGVHCSEIRPLAGPDEAAARLGELVDLYRSGMREPLPIACATGAAWACAGEDADSRWAAAKKAWSDGIRPERDEPPHIWLYGRKAPLSCLSAPRPQPDESGAGWSSLPSRFGRLTERIWRPLLAAEEEVSG